MHFPTLRTRTNIFSVTCNILYSVQFKVEPFRVYKSAHRLCVNNIYSRGFFFKSWDCNQCKSVRIYTYIHVHTDTHTHTLTYLLTYLFHVVHCLEFPYLNFVYISYFFIVYRPCNSSLFSHSVIISLIYSYESLRYISVCVRFC